MSKEHEIWSIARRGAVRKMICGAAVVDRTEVERMAFIAAKVMQHVVDVSGTDPEVVEAADKGRTRAMAGSNEAGPIVMASITPHRGDLHFQKAEFGPECNGCGSCQMVCPNQAIEQSGAGSVFLKSSLCRGCGYCVEVCPVDNIKLSAIDVPPVETATAACLAAGADAIELHLSGYSAEEVGRILHSSAGLFEGTILSVCIGSQMSSPREIMEVVQVIGEARRGIPTFVQADGSTMAGSVHGLSALATAEVVLSCGFPDLLVICSGGCSAVTWRIARLARLPIAGVGSGIALRQRLVHLIEREDCLESESVWREAMDICRDISEGAEGELRATGSIAHGSILGTALNRIRTNPQA